MLKMKKESQVIIKLCTLTKIYIVPRLASLSSTALDSAEVLHISGSAIHHCGVLADGGG